MISAWKNEFENYPEVHIIKDDIFCQKADAIVSPGNSYGLMDAGLDKLTNEYFHLDMEKKLQETIKKKYHGELPVGIAAIIKTDDNRFPYFISSPTMRVPMRLKESVNVYLAIRAVFVAIDEFNKSNLINSDNLIKSVIIPGMGIGSGRMPYDIAAKQAKRAYESILYGKTQFPEEWNEAVQRHKDLMS